MTCGVQERARGAQWAALLHVWVNRHSRLPYTSDTRFFSKRSASPISLPPFLGAPPSPSLSLSLSLALSLSLFYQLLAALRFTCRFICRCPARSRSLLLPFLPRLLLSLRQRAASCERRAAPSLLPLLLLHAAFGRCFEGPAEQALQGALRQPERGDHLLFRRWHTRSIHGAASQRG